VIISPEPDIDKESIKKKYYELKSQIDSVINNKDSSKIKKLIEKLYAYRQSGLDKNGAEIIDGSQIKQSIKNGSDGKFYKVIFEITTNEGNTYIDVILISVYSIPA